MKEYTVHQAKTQLSKLIQEALDGEDVIIKKRNIPVVKLCMIEQPRRESVLGDLKGKIWMSDDFNETPPEFLEYT